MRSEVESLIADIGDWLRRNPEWEHDAEVPDLLTKARRNLESLGDDLEELEGDKEKLETRISEEESDIADVVHSLLDGVERPVGSLRATLPDTPANQRALIALHDAVNRNL